METLITKDKIYKLGRNNGIIHQCIMNYEHSHLSWEAALALMVYSLAETNEKQTKMLTDMMKNSVCPIMTTNILDRKE